MERSEIILATLAQAPTDLHSPVQVQKLLFLLEKKAAHLIGGQKFHFVPYDYGPFDKDIYNDLLSLSSAGLVELVGDPYSKGRRYKLSKEGERKAGEILSRAAPALIEFLPRLSKFVRSLSFADLVSSVYRAYPEMRVNSVFNKAE